MKTGMKKASLRGDRKKKFRSFVKFPLVLRGRTFNASNLNIIRDCVREFFPFGRTRISEEVCKRLSWKQPNGWLKDRACRDVLVRLARLKIIALPRRKKKPNKDQIGVRRKRRSKFVFQPIAVTNEISLEFAKGNKQEGFWNRLVNKHHYLGHKVVVGRCIKYLINHLGSPVGAICFSSAAWEIKPRDTILKEIGFSRKRIRNHVINNSRFLIVPSATVPNLASQALSLAAKQVAHDWAEFYLVTPQIVETFVQPSRFHGTCYKAANWLEVGRTKGYAKHGRNHVNSQESKRIFLYGLTKAMRRKLLKVSSKTKSPSTNGVAEHNS